MPDEKSESIFSKEYIGELQTTDKTGVEPSEPEHEIKIDIIKYGVNKPRRTVIRANISNDPN